MGTLRAAVDARDLHDLPAAVMDALEPDPEWPRLDEGGQYHLLAVWWWELKLDRMSTGADFRLMEANHCAFPEPLVAQ